MSLIPPLPHESTRVAFCESKKLPHHREPWAYKANGTNYFTSLSYNAIVQQQGFTT
ncbi:MAG: hypothetical protein JW783_00615 [Bacteroidales bacterium]|nr:hypothetical protein [Bacteroidales bacterium]MBN2748524.1 hypothetical protein [Bacteroidales bacterium]